MYRDTHSNKLNIAQSSRSVKHKPTPMKRQGKIKHRVVTKTESRHSQSVAGLQQNVAGLQQNQATLVLTVHQRDAVVGEANTSFTRLQEEYQTAEQARSSSAGSHLIALIGSQHKGDQYVQTLTRGSTHLTRCRHALLSTCSKTKMAW
eukprot:1439767-Amphidinium_carterae.1